MDSAVAQAVRFRHVVFPDSVGWYGRAMMLGPFPDATVRPSVRHDGRQPATGLSADEESFLSGLCSRAGVSVRHYKPETLHRRLPACLRAIRANSVPHARSILRRDPRLDHVAVAALLIGVTSFFRDEAVFEALRRETLPRLTAARKGRPLRVWSVGCSEGAELYSVAMLLGEDHGSGELHGTDCRPDAVARAAAGTFDPAAVRGVPGGMLSRYFTCDRAHYRVVDMLRESTRWHVADALDPGASPPGPWDLILCRNLAIYLQPHAADALWTSLERALRPGGVLVLGKAERPLSARGLIPLGPCRYQKGAA